MSSKNLAQTSKFLALVLRHKPDEIGLQLDNKGWARVEDLVLLAPNHFTIPILQEIVDTDKKARYQFNEDKSLIRACQGHSIKDIDLGLKPITPPDYLYHGTTLPTVSL